MEVHDTHDSRPHVADEGQSNKVTSYNRFSLEATVTASWWRRCRHVANKFTNIRVKGQKLHQFAAQIAYIPVSQRPGHPTLAHNFYNVDRFSKLFHYRTQLQ